MASPPTTLIRQAAAIPVWSGQVCLVTSRSGKRWVIPKGCLEPGKTCGEIALQESWEEAGLLGYLHPEPIGSYLYQKDQSTCYVVAFHLQVTDQTEDYPEKGLRQRLWMPFSQAIQYIEEPQLRELLRVIAGLKAG